MDQASAIGTREEQKRETRAKILQAALEQFAERGFDGASVRDIAKRAGVIHGLIKYHFESKEKLWMTAVDYLFERQTIEMREPEGFQELSASEQARNWLKRYVRYCAKYPEHARIMVQESVCDSERLAWAVEKHIKRNHNHSKTMMSHWRDHGVYPDIPYYILFSIIAAVSQSPFMLAPSVAHSSGVDVTRPEQIDLYADTLIALLLDHKDPQVDTV